MYKKIDVTECTIVDFVLRQKFQLLLLLDKIAAEIKVLVNTN